MPARGGRAFGIVAIFTVLGPLVGALLYMLFVVMTQSGWPWGLTKILVVLSYALGGVPAFLSGLSMAVLASRRGSVALWQAWGAAALAVAVSLALLITATFLKSAGIFWDREWSGPLVMLLMLWIATFPATAACWALSRRLKLL